MGSRVGVLLVLLAMGVGSIGWVLWTSGPQAERREDDSTETAESDKDSPGVEVIRGNHTLPSDVDKSGGDESLGNAPLATQTPKHQSRENAQRNGRAIDHLEAGELDEAIELFEENLEADPDEPIFQQNLAEALVRLALREYDQHPEDALAHLERAIELAPLREELLPLRDRWKTAVQAQAGFTEDQSTHFILQYDGDRSELLSRGYREVLDDLEEAYQDYGEFFDVFPVEAGHPKFRAVLYDREAFDRVTGIGEWAGGAYDGTIRIPVRSFQRDRNRIRHTLRHELVHAFVDVVGGKKVPGWLNEGLAQYLSEDHAANRSRATQRARTQLEGKPLFSLEQLAGSLAKISEPAQVAKAYDQSLAFTQWVVTHYGERTLVRMTQASRKGSDAAASFQRWIGITLTTAHQDFADSL